MTIYKKFLSLVALLPLTSQDIALLCRLEGEGVVQALEGLEGHRSLTENELMLIRKAMANLLLDLPAVLACLNEVLEYKLVTPWDWKNPLV